MPQKLAEDKVDFKIAADGTWFHEGVVIKREALVKLFSDRALMIDEQGHYWLATPYDRYPVEVEDVPFVIIDYEEMPEVLRLRTNMQEEFILSRAHKWELRAGIPYVEVRAGLFARLGRSVYYNLVERFGVQLTSAGATFKLGE